MHAAVGAGVEIHDAVDRHVLRIVAAAHDIDATDTGGARRFAAVGGVDNAGQQADRIENIASTQGQVIEFIVGQDAGFFTRNQVHRHRGGADSHVLGNCADV